MCMHKTTLLLSKTKHDGVSKETKTKHEDGRRGKWSTLPDDLLVDIFRRLDVVSAVIRCAAACRPWRRAIINNASCLHRLRPDRFLPGLPLGFLENHLRSRRYLPWKLQYVPASTVVPASPFLVPPTGVCVDGRLYSHLLCSRDGFLLLGQDNAACDSLCLCITHTGVCKVLPAAEFDDNRSSRSMYVLVTGYDDVVVDDDHSTSNEDDGGGETTAVARLAVDSLPTDAKDGATYQIFSSTTAAWGPVKRSAKLAEDDDVAHVFTGRGGSVVVCHGAVVSWLVYLIPDEKAGIRECMFSMDLRTERTWTTELPPDPMESSSHVLAVSEDGWLSLVKMMSCSRQMEVWVLVGDDGDQYWTLRRTIDDVHKKLLPIYASCPSMWHMSMSGFCPRSGYLFGTGTGTRRDGRNVEHHFLIGVDGSSPRLIGSDESGSNRSCRFPYEMDSSTYISSYISKMKYF